MNRNTTLVSQCCLLQEEWVWYWSRAEWGGSEVDDCSPGETGAQSGPAVHWTLQQRHTLCTGTHTGDWLSPLSPSLAFVSLSLSLSPLSCLSLSLSLALSLSLSAWAHPGVLRSTVCNALRMCFLHCAIHRTLMITVTRQRGGLSLRWPLLWTKTVWLS